MTVFVGTTFVLCAIWADQNYPFILQNILCMNVKDTRIICYYSVNFEIYMI
jgi:hypothetical protein